MSGLFFSKAKWLAAILGLLTLTAQAATTSEKGVFTMKELTLKTSVGKLAANLYLPEGVEKPPVVIVTGAWTTVKEQMPATYAEALAKKGFAALTFDFRGWGESKDSVRFLEDPQRKIADITAVIDALAKRDDINTKQIFALGICASAGYVLDAVLGNDKVVAAAVVAPWLHDRGLANNIYGGEEAVDKLIKLGKESSQAKEPVYIEAASTTNDKSLMYQAPYYTEKDRGLIPEFDNQFNVASWEGWLTYNALANAKQQDKPVLMVASETMALPAGAHKYLEIAGPNVTAVWLKHVTQFDFYDQPKPVADSIDNVVSHFSKYTK